MACSAVLHTVRSSKRFYKIRVFSRKKVCACLSNTEIMIAWKCLQLSFINLENIFFKHPNAFPMTALKKKKTWTLLQCQNRTQLRCQSAGIWFLLFFPFWPSSAVNIQKSLWFATFCTSLKLKMRIRSLLTGQRVKLTQHLKAEDLDLYFFILSMCFFLKIISGNICKL